MSVNLRRIREAMRPMPAPESEAETTSVDMGRVGHEEPSPRWMWLEGNQAFVEVTLRSGDEIVACVAEDVKDLALGDTVVVVYVDSDETQAQVIARVNDRVAPLPNEVAGVSTGAAATDAPGEQVVAPTWYFVRTRAGRLFALETGAGGDVLLHSGAGAHIKATTTHIEGAVRLGYGPTTPPTGSQVAPENAETPGAPMVPVVVPPLANATIPPYAGLSTGVVRASDEYQSNIAIDTIFWTKMVAMETMFLAWATVLPVLKPAHDIYVAVPVPVKLDSKAKSASQTVAAKD